MNSLPREIDDWKNAVELMFYASVVPRRSVDRIRRAITEGRDPEPYLGDIEAGMASIAETYQMMDDRLPACPTCLGTGHGPAVPGHAPADYTNAPLEDAS
jgi:hypothetical protein